MTVDPLRRRALLTAAVAASLAGLHGPLAAQEAYPTHPIRMVVGFAAGGPTDVIARLIAERLRESLGQPVLVENRPGAAGNIAADVVARAPKDGYTLLYASSAIAISPSLYEHLSFDVRRDFAPVAATVNVPMVLMVNPAVPARTLPEFVAYAQAHPGKLSYASSGNGTITHLAGALFSQRNNLRTEHIPYRGTAPALTDLVAGNVQFTLGTINTALPFIKDARLRAIATTGLKRAPSLAALPTLDEAGMKGFEAGAWQGVLAPAGTPPALVARLADEIGKALRKPELASQLAAQDAEVIASTPAAFAAYLDAEITRWTRVVKDTGAKPE